MEEGSYVSLVALSWSALASKSFPDDTSICLWSISFSIRPPNSSALYSSGPWKNRMNSYVEKTNSWG